MSTRASASCVGLGEVQEVGDHLAEGFGLVANALHILLELRRQPFEIEQARVAMNRREAVAELVSDAGGHLAEPREAVLQPQLIFEVRDLAQIAEQANRAVRCGRPRRESAKP